MKVIHAVHPDDFRTYDTDSIRKNFLLDSLAVEGTAQFAYTHYDRMIVGMAIPTQHAISLPNFPNLRADYFLQRREMGIINVGGKGAVKTGEKVYQLNKLDCLYLGRGTESVSFISDDSNAPARFYILSTPAHAVLEPQLLQQGGAESAMMGSAAGSNHRTIYRYIHLNGIRSCQLVMGLTILHTGSVWNTMPPHTHDRRMEAYFYFDVPEDAVVFHLMGAPQETRHIVVRNHQAVLSPTWSIHAGSGTAAYGFIWGMGGENLEYGDMDAVSLQQIK